MSECIPPGAFEPVNLKEYSKLITETYEELYPYPRGVARRVDPAQAEEDNLRVDIQRLEAIASETFLASIFLPCHHDLEKKVTASGLRAEVVVAHPNWAHVDLLCIPEIPKLANNKHLSLQNMKIAYKDIKKVKQIRQFSFPDSIFADWRKDTPQSLATAFELDAQFVKTFKFIKDPVDREKTMKVLGTYFGPLKNQF